MFVICTDPADLPESNDGTIASAKVTYVKGLEPGLPGCENEARECLEKCIMKVLEKKLSWDETPALILESKAKGFGGAAPAGKKRAGASRGAEPTMERKSQRRRKA